MREQVINEILLRLDRIIKGLENHQETLSKGLQGELFNEYQKLLFEEQEKVKAFRKDIIRYFNI